MPSGVVQLDVPTCLLSAVCYLRAPFPILPPPSSFSSNLVSRALPLPLCLSLDLSIYATATAAQDFTPYNLTNVAPGTWYFQIVAVTPVDGVYAYGDVLSFVMPVPVRVVYTSPPTLVDNVREGRRRGWEGVGTLSLPLPSLASAATACF